MRDALASAGRGLARWYSVPLLFALWQVLHVTGAVSPRLLPDLRDVANTLVTDIGSGLLPFHAAVSMGRALAGYLLASIAGIALGIALARSRLVDMLVEPMFVAGYPVPKIALFPIFTFIFGIGSLSKIAFVFIECLYPVTLATVFAVRGVERNFVWSAASMGAGARRIFARVLIPAALPGIFSGLRIALPVAIIVVTITEMIGDARGLGYFISVSSASFRFDRVYAGIVMVGACGFVLDRSLAALRRVVLPWVRDAQRL